MLETDYLLCSYILSVTFGASVFTALALNSMIFCLVAMIWLAALLMFRDASRSIVISPTNNLLCLLNFSSMGMNILPALAGDSKAWFWVAMSALAAEFMHFRSQ